MDPWLRSVAETGSTNDDMAALARAGAPEGSWLRADRQTGGRGRQGRAWSSPTGNFYASTLVRLRPDDPAPATLALVAAVALHEIVSAHAPARIKWPNDLMLGEAKLAGILLERAEDRVVIGIGVNLAHHPEGLERPVTSLAAAAGEAPEPRAFLERLAESFARWLGRWRSEGIGPIRRQWLAAAHPLGTALSTPDGEGLFDGLDQAGALLLRLPDGSRRTINAGDVFLL